MANSTIQGMYLHYWFSDYAGRAGGNNADLYTNFLKAKGKLGYQQYFGKNGIATLDYNQRLKEMQSSWGVNDKEFENIVAFLTGDDKVRAEIFEAEAPQNVSVLGLLRESIGENTENVSPEQIATIIDDFLVKLKKAIEEIFEKIEGPTWENFKNNVVKDYASHDGKNLTGSALKQAIIADFLTHEGLVKLNLSTTTTKGADQAGLQTALRNISLLLEALPEYGAEGNSSMGAVQYSTSKTAEGTMDKTENGLGTLFVIARKLQGLFNNVVGQSGELAWSTAEEKWLKDLISEGKISWLDGTAIVETKVIGGNQLETVRTGKADPTMKKDLDKKTKKGKKKTVSKGDVRVTISDDKILISYGISVKTYSFSTSTGAKTVALVDNTPFLDAANKLFGDRGGIRYMVNLAGGNPGVRFDAQGENLKEYSLSELNERWDALVQEVTARNFIDVIAGVVTKEGPTTLYLVINGQIIPILTILNNLANGVLNFSSRAVNDSGYVLRRSSLMKLNTWHFSTGYTKNRKADLMQRYKGQADKTSKIAQTKMVREAAIARSNEASANIIAQLQAAKLTVSLTQLENLLK